MCVCVCVCGLVTGGKGHSVSGDQRAARVAVPGCCFTTFNTPTLSYLFPREPPTLSTYQRTYMMLFNSQNTITRRTAGETDKTPDQSRVQVRVVDSQTKIILLIDLFYLFIEPFFNQVKVPLSHNNSSPRVSWPRQAAQRFRKHPKTRQGHTLTPQMTHHTH